MSSAAEALATPNEAKTATIQARIEREIENLLASLPDPAQLSADERRGLIARYTAVLEGNFIYWMTGAYLSVGSDEARAKYNDAVRRDFRRRFYGLTFWSPNINIFRDPRWGRIVEGAGEDAFLGERFSALDIYIDIMTRWSPKRGWFESETPHLFAIARRADQLPQLGEVWKRNFPT